MNRTEQAMIVEQGEIEGSQGITRLAFFNEDGTPFDFGDSTPPTPLTLADVAAAIGVSESTLTDAMLPVSHPQAAAQSDSVASEVVDLVTDFNALLAKLRAAGIIAAEVGEEE